MPTYESLNVFFLYLAERLHLNAYSDNILLFFPKFFISNFSLTWEPSFLCVQNVRSFFKIFKNLKLAFEPFWCFFHICFLKDVHRRLSNFVFYWKKCLNDVLRKKYDQRHKRIFFFFFVKLFKNTRYPRPKNLTKKTLNFLSKKRSVHWTQGF